MKKVISIILMAAMLLTIVPLEAAFATTIPNISINGDTFISPSGEPDPYINKDERTMIPIRFFAEALGVPDDEEHIVWDQETQTATITDGKNTVIIPLGSKEITVNNKTVIMDTVAEMKNHRVFIPARFLAEGLDANVQWDGENRRVVIFTRDFLDNHPVMESKQAIDIDDPFLAVPFYEVISAEFRNYRTFGNSETFLQRIQEARKLADKIDFEIDKVNEKITVTIPDHDPKNLFIALNFIGIGQHTEPGTYSMLFEDAKEGKLMTLYIADVKYGAANLYMLSVFIRDGEVGMLTGNKGWDMFRLLKEEN